MLVGAGALGSAAFERIAATASRLHLRITG
jgi:hypothetical protein